MSCRLNTRETGFRHPIDVPEYESEARHHFHSNLNRHRRRNNRQSPRALTADSDQQPNHPNNRHRRHPNTAELQCHPYQARCRTSVRHHNQHSFRQDSYYSRLHQQSDHHQHHRLCRCHRHRHHLQPILESPTMRHCPKDSDQSLCL